MRSVVRAGWVSFTASFESLLYWLYLDVKGLVTIGAGNLVDPPMLMRGLVFRRKDGSIATGSEVQAAWLAVKNLQPHAKDGGGSKVFENASSLRATPESVATFIFAKLDLNESILKKTFSKWAEFPACVQAAILSMAWAYGANFTRTWPHFTNACQTQEWAIAARECAASAQEISRQNNSFKRRNATQVALFLHAAKGGDPEALMTVEEALIEGVNEGKNTATLRGKILSPEEHKDVAGHEDVVYTVPQ